MKTNNQLTSLLRTAALLVAITACGINETKATTKTAILSGAWSNALIWLPLGVPSPSDDVVINSGVTVTINSNQSCDDLTVNSGSFLTSAGILTWSTSSTLTIDGNLYVAGTVKMNGGNITQTQSGGVFTITNSGTFEWEPGTNTLAGATLFTNSVESFSINSTLKIRKWYDYTNVPLSNVISGNFGNLYMSSPGTGSNVMEWNQNNQFQTHVIYGTLYISSGWITLDRSGFISSTYIGGISILDNNSLFYAHRGTHPSSFTLSTNSISNAGGTFIGLLNGNGNITINVNGDITNTGNFNVIKNDGVLNVGNGNAVLNVAGTYYQSNGDFRIIYNISTINSGVFTADIGGIEFDGGIFMGQYACHTAAQTCTLIVENNINSVFSSGSEKFRVLGLTSLSGNNNNAKLYFYVGGNLTITSQSNGAEFSTSASTGIEENIIIGTFQTSGGQTNIDYGTGQASHNSTLTVYGNMTALSGTLNLSRLDGTTTIIVHGDVNVGSGATLSVKGGNGTATMTINGNYVQTGGTFNLHANTAVIATSPVTVTVNGDFTQSGGSINFDANGSSVSAIDHLVINGANFTLSGTSASMTQAGAGSNTVFGFLEFTRQGTTRFNRTNANHVLTQIKIIVGSGTTLDVYTGNVQLASHSVAGTDFLTVQNGGTLMLRAGQIYSAGTYTYSGFRVESGGTISTMNLFGFYDGTNFAAIKSGFNMNFYLDVNSTVEYNGWSNQKITGIGAGIATTVNHKYGKLKINFNGTPDLNYLYPNDTNVFVRTQLMLDKGELKLNGKPITFENGAASAVSRTSGYVKSETAAAKSNSTIVWQNMTSGSHEFPFGRSSTVYIPVFFSPVSGMGGTVSISTRSTAQDNEPRPYVSSLNQTATALSSSEANYAENKMIDRWWDIEATGFTASLTLSYPGDENTILNQYRTGEFSFDEYHNGTWLSHNVTGNGITSGIGTLTMSNASTFSSWVITVRGAAPLPVSLIDFTAVPAKNSVSLSWATAMEVNSDYFTLEKSSDGINFNPFAQVKGAGNSTSVKTYKHTDKDVTEGITYYRLNQTDFDGTTVHHKIVSVNLGNVFFENGITVQNVYPSPFSDRFTVLINAAQMASVKVSLTDMNGKVIRSESFISEKGNNSYNYENSENIPNGIYFLNISALGKTITKKIIKG